MMQQIWNYSVAFWSVVVVNCAKPVNWEYCYRIDQWLIPDLVHAWEIKTRRYVPYQEEKEYLKQVR